MIPLPNSMQQYMSPYTLNYYNQLQSMINQSAYLQPMPLTFNSAVPAIDKTPNLTWLDKRVDELRVKL